MHADKLDHAILFFSHVFSPVFPCESDIDDQYIWIPARHAVSFG